jgi:hypothetical protein
MLLMSLACDAIALGSNQVEVEVEVSSLRGDNSLKSVERFDHMMFVCRFQASR